MVKEKGEKKRGGGEGGAALIILGVQNWEAFETPFSFKSPISVTREASQVTFLSL